MVRRSGAIAIFAGAVVGTVFRNVPVTLAIALARGSSTRRCGMEEALDCAFANLPDAFAALVRFAAVLLVISVLLLIAGVTLILLGRQRLRSTPESGPTARAVTLLAIGVAAITPVVWLAGVLCLSVAT